jgi:2-polyprenyl-3-methyl-5-hydroxy-6-metoxy-1,4-benzoquinol methylase
MRNGDRNSVANNRIFQAPVSDASHSAGVAPALTVDAPSSPGTEPVRNDGRLTQRDSTAAPADDKPAAAAKAVASDHATATMAADPPASIHESASVGASASKHAEAANSLSGFIARLRCPACRGSLQEDGAERLVCEACGAGVNIVDGIADFVAGRFDTILDASGYDESHGIDDAGARTYYHQIKRHAGARWPASLGVALEIGCGTGYLSRVLVESGDASALLLTDVSADMLRVCRSHLERLGLLARMSLGFATYSSHEDCLRDAAFDTCVGGSVLHHIPDVSAFLRSVLRVLKPGGRAFFVEPSLRFHAALAQSLAEILALMYGRSPAHSHDRQLALNWLAQTRQQMTHQGDIAFLSTFEDKHLFIGETFEDMALDLGYARAVAIPFGPDSSGEITLRALFGQLGISAEFTAEVLRLLPLMHGRHLALLHRADQAPHFLLWLERGDTPIPRLRQAARPPRSTPRTEDLAPRHHLILRMEAIAQGLSVHIRGWYLARGDVAGISIILNGVTHMAPVWRPRSDVHLALNQTGSYPAWNALCCGVESALTFDGVLSPTGTMILAVYAVLTSGATLPIAAPASVGLGETLTLAQ